MTAFADHNKDYFRADYNALREGACSKSLLTWKDTMKSLDAPKCSERALNYNLNRNKQAELDALVAKLKAARRDLKPAATHSGNLDKEMN